MITIKSRLKTNNVSRFDNKSSFKTLLRCCPHWDYRPNNDYFSRNKSKRTRKEKIQIKCNCIDESKLNGIRELIFQNLCSEKLTGFQIISDLNTLLYIKKRICIE